MPDVVVVVPDVVIVPVAVVVPDVAVVLAIVVVPVVAVFVVRKTINSNACIPD